MSRLTRRETLKIGGGLGMAVLAGPAFARTEADEIIADFTGGRTPAAEGIVLDVPVLAENARTVPVRVAIPEPMSEASWCEELIVVLERNPRPLASRFRFTPRIGVVDVSTRLRLAESQEVAVLARMSDGRLLGARRAVTVTDNSCSA